MNKLKFKILKKDRTINGSIKNRDNQVIKQHLLHSNLVIVPSDTCYSIAACAFNEELYKKINKILNRKDIPISIAFPNYIAAEEFADLNFRVRGILEKFTPGPITVICSVTNHNLYHQKIGKIIRSKDNTIGIRIPDSFLEREVAGITKYPITTVAIRDAKGNVVQKFEQAIEIVLAGIQKLNDKIDVGAIEGDSFFDTHSTVVRVIDGDIKLERKGEIPFNEIKSIINDYPISEIEDWT